MKSRVVVVLLVLMIFNGFFTLGNASRAVAIPLREIDIVKIMDALEFMPGPLPCERIDFRIFKFVYENMFKQYVKIFDHQTHRSKVYRCRAVLAEIGA